MKKAPSELRLAPPGKGGSYPRLDVPELEDDPYDLYGDDIERIDRLGDLEADIIRCCGADWAGVHAYGDADPFETPDMADYYGVAANAYLAAVGVSVCDRNDATNVRSSKYLPAIDAKPLTASGTDYLIPEANPHVSPLPKDPFAIYLENLRMEEAPPRELVLSEMALAETICEVPHPGLAVNLVGPADNKLLVVEHGYQKSTTPLGGAHFPGPGMFATLKLIEDAGFDMRTLASDYGDIINTVVHANYAFSYDVVGKRIVPKMREVIPPQFGPTSLVELLHSPIAEWVGGVVDFFLLRPYLVPPDIPYEVGRFVRGLKFGHVLIFELCRMAFSWGQQVDRYPVIRLPELRLPDSLVPAASRMAKYLNPLARIVQRSVAFAPYSSDDFSRLLQLFGLLGIRVVIGDAPPRPLVVIVGSNASSNVPVDGLGVRALCRLRTAYIVSRRLSVPVRGICAYRENPVIVDGAFVRLHFSYTRLVIAHTCTIQTIGQMVTVVATPLPPAYSLYEGYARVVCAWAQGIAAPPKEWSYYAKFRGIIPPLPLPSLLVPFVEDFVSCSGVDGKPMGRNGAEFEPFNLMHVRNPPLSPLVALA